MSPIAATSNVLVPGYLSFNGTCIFQSFFCMAVNINPRRYSSTPLALFYLLADRPPSVLMSAGHGWRERIEGQAEHIFQIVEKAVHRAGAVRNSEFAGADIVDKFGVG